MEAQTATAAVVWSKWLTHATQDPPFIKLVRDDADVVVAHRRTESTGEVLRIESVRFSSDGTAGNGATHAMAAAAPAVLRMMDPAGWTVIELTDGTSLVGHLDASLLTWGPLLQAASPYAWTAAVADASGNVTLVGPYDVNERAVARWGGSATTATVFRRTGTLERDGIPAHLDTSLALPCVSTLRTDRCVDVREPQNSFNGIRFDVTTLPIVDLTSTTYTLRVAALSNNQPVAGLTTISGPDTEAVMASLGSPGWRLQRFQHSLEGLTTGGGLVAAFGSYYPLVGGPMGWMLLLKEVGTGVGTVVEWYFTQPSTVYDALLDTDGSGGYAAMLSANGGRAYIWRFSVASPTGATSACAYNRPPPTALDGGPVLQAETIFSSSSSGPALNSVAAGPNNPIAAALPLDPDGGP